MISRYYFNFYFSEFWCYQLKPFFSLSHIWCNFSFKPLIIIYYALRNQLDTWQEVRNSAYDPRVDHVTWGTALLMGAKKCTWPRASWTCSWWSCSTLTMLERVPPGSVDRQWLWHQTCPPSKAGSTTYPLYDLGQGISISSDLNSSTVQWEVTTSL